MLGVGSDVHSPTQHDVTLPGGRRQVFGFARPRPIASKSARKRGPLSAQIQPRNENEHAGDKKYV